MHISIVAAISTRTRGYNISKQKHKDIFSGDKEKRELSNE